MGCSSWRRLRKCRRYKVGDKYFPCADVDETDVATLFEQCGFDRRRTRLRVEPVAEQRALGYEGIVLASGFSTRPAQARTSHNRHGDASAGPRAAQLAPGMTQTLRHLHDLPEGRRIRRGFVQDKSKCILPSFSSTACPEGRAEAEAPVANTAETKEHSANVRAGTARQVELCHVASLSKTG